MIILFVILLILLGMVMQRYSMYRSIDAVESDYWPEQNIVDPEEEFDVVISLKNKTRWNLHYIRAEHTYYRGIEVSPNLRGVHRDPGTGNHIVKVSTWVKPGQKTLIRIPILYRKEGDMCSFIRK